MEDNLNQNALVITDDIKSFLKEAGKWSKILAIFGFIGLGIMVIVGIFSWLFLGAASLSNSGMSGLEAGLGGIMAFMYVIIAILYYFPLSYLYKFSTNIKTAINSNDQYQLSSAFENLKKHYKFIAIFAIIILIVYAFIFLLTIIIGAGSMF